MNIEDRLVEVMAELLAEVHEMRKDISGVHKGIDGLRGDVTDLKREQAKTNIEIQELRLSIMKLADFSERIIRLEQEVFKKAS